MSNRLKERGWFVAVSFIASILFWAVVVSGVLIYVSEILLQKNP